MHRSGGIVHRRAVRARLFVLAAVLVLPAAPVHAYVPERTPERDAEASARRMLAQPAARTATPGVVVLRGGRPIYALNADRPFVPASLLKLFTTTTAIVRFGPNHRFATRALVSDRGPVVRHLYLVGGGDPTFATERYRRERYEPKPTDTIRRSAFRTRSPTVEQLAARIARHVRVVRGNLVVDETLFDGRRVQAGWLPRYLRDSPETGLLSALGVNEGRADLKGTKLVGRPAISTGGALRRALQTRGVTVLGAVRSGRAPSRAAEVGRVLSPPVGELVDFINRYSINYPAELLLKSLGARFGRSGSTREGVKVVVQTLSRLGVPLRGFRMADGSGLSVLNRVAPSSVAAVLERILSEDGRGWEILRESIPVAGQSGTLLRRMRDGAAEGNLRGKTGLIRSVRAMAGWVRGTDGIPLVYVAVFNGAERALALTEPLDLFGESLARYPGA